MNNLYVIVMWPESQHLMSYDWFDTECHLINDEHGLEEFGSSAYFVPQKRLDEIEEKDFTTK